MTISLRKPALNFDRDHKLRLEAMCSISSRYDVDKDRSMTAHFLHYSAIAYNLTSKLTESETVEIISGHYPAYVKRTLLSTGVKTIRDVLNLLNRLESLEADRKGDSNPVSSAQNRGNMSDCVDKNSQDRNYRARPGFRNVRNMSYQGTRNYDSNSNIRHERDSPSSGKGRQDVQGRAMPSHGNGSRRNLNPESNNYAPRSDSGEFSLNAIEISPVNQNRAGFVETVLRAVKPGSQTMKLIHELTLHI
jgi:hypothetical protein